MGAVKINGTTSGSVSLEAPASGSDVTLTLPGTTMNLGTELASKLPIAGGKILQIVRATDATERTTTSATYVDASISVTISPQKSDSAVLLLWSFAVRNTTEGAGNFLRITDASNNAISGAEESAFSIGNGFIGSLPALLFARATPATTSAVTYKGRFRCDSGTLVIRNADRVTGQLYAIEVSA